MASACPSAAQLQVKAQLVSEPVLTWAGLVRGPRPLLGDGAGLTLASSGLVSEMPGVGQHDGLPGGLGSASVSPSSS